jgi:hypothetical protein
MAKGPLGFHGGEKKNPAVVDSWERNNPGKEITYTIRTVPSKMAHIYHCQIIQKLQGEVGNREDNRRQTVKPSGGRKTS